MGGQAPEEVVHSRAEAEVVQKEDPLLEEPAVLTVLMASLSLRDSVWAKVRKSATKSFGQMGTPAMTCMTRPGLY
jgi:hypothetical protein